MRTYRTSRKGPLVAMIANALEASGMNIVKKPPAGSAPFVFEVVTPVGEALRLICYAFTANKYRQSGRPDDEHRFQIKYGSDFAEYHQLYIGDGVRDVTLFFGCHLEEGIFVAVDPVMHNPTWFSKSVEFKDEHIELGKRLGWFGWERPRSPAGRRKREMPLLSYQTEAVLAFAPDQFYRYVQLERFASGIEPGQRLLLADRLSARPPSEVARFAPEATFVHPLEKEMGLSADELLNMIGSAFRLKVAVKGWAAETHLEKHLEHVDGIDDLQQLDEDGRPDFEVHYRGRGPFFIECKNVLRRRSRGLPKVDFQKTRAAKGNPCSRYYLADDFDVLAACLHPVTESWEFRFRPTATMDEHPKCPGRIRHNNVFVNGDAWDEDVGAVLASL